MRAGMIRRLAASVLIGIIVVLAVRLKGKRWDVREAAEDILRSQTDFYYMLLHSPRAVSL